MIGICLKSLCFQIEGEQNLQSTIAASVSSFASVKIIATATAWLLAIVPSVFMLAQSVYYACFNIGCPACYSIPTCVYCHPLACLAAVAVIFMLINMLGAYIYKRTNRRLLGKLILVWSRSALLAYLISAIIVCAQAYCCK